MIRFGVKATEPVHGVIVPDEDLHTFSISHPVHIRLIESPLATEEDIHHGAHSHPDSTLKHQSESTANEVNGTHDGSRHSSSASSEDDPSAKRHPDEPILKRAHEASTIQLFFDLFFVANLTTFSTVHEVDTWPALGSYVGYFAIIWFTWFENTMFDVRFSNDSVFERLCKVMQFGIMTGFAVTGPGYITGAAPGTPNAENSVTAFKALSLILMSSRLILTFQYSVAFFWIRSYKKAFWPMLAHIGTLFCAAMIFLGLFFAFSQTSSERVLAGWYVTVVCEAAIILAVSGNVTFLSFRKTVLVERLGLLTLIILGEGIIDMCTSINNVGSDNAYSSDIIGMIICSVCTIYSMWMLYFDQVQPERMGTLRQQVWAILHFPFHVSILLIVEGLSRLSVWRKVIDVVSPLQDATNGFDATASTSNVLAQLQSYNQSVNALFNDFNTNTRPDLPNIGAFFTQAASAANAGDSAAVSSNVSSIFNSCLSWACLNFKVKLDGANADGDIDLSPAAQAQDLFGLFAVVFVYFFVFAGVNLLVLGLLFLLGKRRKLRGELLSVLVRWVAGIALCLVATIDTNGQDDTNNNLHKFIYSPWMLPTVLITYLLVIVIDNLLIRYVKSVAHFRLHNRHPKTENGEVVVPPSPVKESEESKQSAAMA